MMSETVVTVDPNRQPQAQPKPAAQSQGSLSWVKFNIGYFQTIPGILKLIQLVNKHFFYIFFFSFFDLQHNNSIIYRFSHFHTVNNFPYLCAFISEN